MLETVQRYSRWLHTRWPAGTVEKLPVVNEDGSTNVRGLYVVGDLTGIPLLKFSVDTGTRSVRTISADKSFLSRDISDPHVVDLAVIGGGVSGFAAALEAKRLKLRFVLLEAAEPFSTIVNFPKAKPIYTYPTDMTPAGDLQFHDKSSVKEGLLEDLREQTLAVGIESIPARVAGVKRRGGVFELDIPGQEPLRAHRVIVAIGRSGNYRKLDVSGEDLDKVYNRLHDPKDFRDQDVLVVGGGDSALETAIALADCGARVTLSYRKPEFSRPKPENVEKLTTLASSTDPGSPRLYLSSRIKEIRDEEVVIEDKSGEAHTIANNAVFSMIGREAPLDFFRKSGVKIAGDRGWTWWTSLIVFVLFCLWLYQWKAQYTLPSGWQFPHWLDADPQRLISWLQGFSGAIGRMANDPTTLLGTLAISAQSRGFYYTLAYSLLVLIFGIRRIRRRRTPYVTVQTLTLTAVQCLPLFILPEIILPLLGHHGAFDSGALQSIADSLFPEADWGHGREYWRAYGFILAWPLMVWNWFTDSPMWGWLIIGFLQTFVIIPALVYRWGKGAYCGWICSCGALAETLGDQQRHKMPHGPIFNRLNMIGQVILAIAILLMLARILGWAGVAWADHTFQYGAKKLPFLNFNWTVDLFLAGVLGYGLYFWFSGRVWCRFACPLAALMHIYARFSQFRILADKKKCISCNVCTSVCHQGIDVMSFANKGLEMEDPECVRCSACVQSCPTGVLTFGRVSRRTGEIVATDHLAASPVQMAELTVGGKAVAH